MLTIFCWVTQRMLVVSLVNKMVMTLVICFGAQTVTSQGYVDTADVEEAKPLHPPGGDVAVPIADYNRMLYSRQGFKV